jgi:hypothetical protein
LTLYSKDHLQLLRALKKRDVKFLIIGEHAAIYYGVNRNTGDLDILIEPSRINGRKLVAALNDLDLEIPTFEEGEFESNLVLSFGLEPDAVDILNYTPGIEFEDAYARSISTSFSGIDVRMIDIRDLIKNKEALNRSGEKSHLDKYDIEVLKRIVQNKK